MKKEQKIFITVLLVYFILNLLNTYFLTTEPFNRYITTFDRNFFTECTSIIGNIAVLSIFLAIGLWVFRKPKHLYFYLLFVTLILNVAVIALGFFTKNYKAMFSLYNFNLMRNPDGGFTQGVILDAVIELFVYYRIAALLPFVLLLSYGLVKRKDFSKEKMKVSVIRKMILSTGSILTSLAMLLFFLGSLEYNWMFRTEVPMYGAQTAGVYNYYLSEFIYGFDYRDKFSTVDFEKTENSLEQFNKNKELYQNFLDGKHYANQDFQTGIWKGKNVYVLQLETYHNFVLNREFNGKEVTPYFNQLIASDSTYRDMVYYFDQAYTVVGMGNTADAEFATHTGLIPSGDMTIHWDFADRDFTFPSIVKHLPESYSKNSYNNTAENFYNHKNVMEHLFGYDQFHGKETFEQEFNRAEHEEKYLYQWISDKSLQRWATTHAREREKQNFYTFSMTITPHTPYINMKDHYLTDTEYYDYQQFNWSSDSNKQMNRYLDQIHHNDKILFDFLMSVMDENSEYYLENTIFILYGDHGNSLSQKTYEKLFERKLTEFEYKKILLNIPIIVIDPSLALDKSIKESGMARETIEHQVKSQRDIYRTLMNGLGIAAKGEKIYGVNIFSGEPSFTYDPKNVDIITDDIIYCYKNKDYELSEHAQLDLNAIETIAEYKKLQDYYISLIVNRGKARKNNGGSI